MNTKTLTLILSSALTFTASINAGNFTRNIEANGVYIDNANGRIVEDTTNVWHKIKNVEGGGVPVTIANSGGQDVLLFQSRSNGAEKERSEVRVRAADIDFDQWHYMKFTFKIARNSDINVNKDWNIITQCAQIYTVDATHTAKSPPLSFQIKNQRLYVKTITNYNTKWYPEHYVGWVTKGQWMTVWMRFKLGANGGIVTKYNSQVQRASYRPIGYDGHYNPFHADPTNKSCSFRFGIYRKGSADTNRLTEVEFKKFEVSSQYISQP